MFKMNKSKNLIVVVGLILFVVGVTFLPGCKKKETNHKLKLVDVQRTDIDKITFLMPDVEYPYAFVKESDGWKIAVNGKSFPADPKIIKGVLGKCTNMRSLRVAGNNKDRWEGFKVDEKNAIFLEYFVKGEKVAGLYVGEFSYLAQQSQNSMQANQGQGRLTTYVREEGDKKTHSVDSYLQAFFTKDVKYYRIKTLFRADKTKVTRVYAELADGTKYDIRRTQPGVFTIDGMPANENAIIKFFHSADNINSRDLVDDLTQADLSGPFDMIRFEGEDMTPVVVKAYHVNDDRNYIMTSSMNPGAYFADPIERLHRMIFKSRAFYFGKAQE